ncbi:hypothetical protein [Flammeovirga pacifica]|uniref:Adhesin n=1 Tax=Flammeovirga pacifica TaxID=915059 RepID=A0A1S1YVC2_FLAPC|nr:hypothetical protein [Flammeovirga pacifica]OHX64971.1 hypothetical protein NH26_00710 [Flammeovirga pacifica]
MALQDRNTLKEFFKKGALPSASHFSDLIESSVNKIDDGLNKNMENGLSVTPVGRSEKLISFFKNIEEKSPLWSFDIDKATESIHLKDKNKNSLISFTHQKVGIQKEDPQYTLDVNGWIGAEGVIGTYKQGKIPGDGKWHNILENLSGCHMYEIVAGIGKKQTGKYSMIIANAVSTYGKSKSAIDYTRAYYGVRCNQIQLRWKGDVFNYALQMRTRCDYEDDILIKYYITKKWYDTFMDDDEANV